MRVTALVLLLSFFFIVSARSQSPKDTIVVAPGSEGIHFYHIVEKGETLHSISTQFNSSVDRLAQINGLDQNAALKVFSMIKVPLDGSNFSQSGNKTANAGNKPLFHKVSKGETLFGLGKMYDDIPLAQLRDWNNLSGNDIKINQYLIVGWLKKGTATAAAASKAPPPDPSPEKGQASSTNPQSNPEINSSQKTPSPAKSGTAHASNPVTTSTLHSSDDAFLREVISAEKSKVMRPKKEGDSVARPLLGEEREANHPPASNRPLLAEKEEATQKIQQDNSPRVKTPKEQPQTAPESEKKTPLAKETDAEVTPPPLNQEKSSPILSAAPESPSRQPAAEENHPDKGFSTDSIADQKEAVEQSAESNEDQTDNHSDSIQLARESEFSELYLAQTQNEHETDSKKGAAGWFKSNIEPGSKKYYALCDDLPRGTIVKVVNPINDRYVYVKVLAPIPKLKENYNLIIKLSDAAKEDLEIDENQFWSQIVYPHVN